DGCMSVATSNVWTGRWQFVIRCGFDALELGSRRDVIDARTIHAEPRRDVVLAIPPGNHRPHNCRIGRRQRNAAWLCPSHPALTTIDGTLDHYCLSGRIDCKSPLVGFRLIWVYPRETVP